MKGMLSGYCACKLLYVSRKLQIFTSGTVMKKGILIIVLISLVFMWSCSKDIYSIKKICKKIEYPNDIISVDPNDTITINKYSLTENITIIRIEEKKEFYNIIIQSDSIRTIFDLEGNIIDSFYINYQVVSPKMKNIRVSQKIKKGQRYTLTLTPCFISVPDVLASIYTVYVFTKRICIPVIKSTMSIYTTPNLDGLYYIPLSKKHVKNKKKERK